MTSPRWMRTLVCLTLTGFWGTACTASSPSRDVRAPRPNLRPVVVITNDHWYPVNIYHVRSGVRFRLGTVHTIGTEVFRLPAYAEADGTLQLLIDPLGSGNSYLTDPILIGPGQSVIFRVQTRLAASSWFIRE